MGEIFFSGDGNSGYLSSIIPECCLRPERSSGSSSERERVKEWVWGEEGEVDFCSFGEEYLFGSTVKVDGEYAASVDFSAGGLVDVGYSLV